VAFERDAYMVRGLDYYTKTVFEVTHPKLGAQDALGAGGRYDKLIETFGGSPAGAVGFAIGVERLLMVLGQENAEKTLRDDAVFVATLGEKAFAPGFKLANALRRAGIRTGMDLSAKSLKSQLRSANDERARWVVIAGEDELSRGELALKDLKNGTQETIRLDTAVETLKGKTHV
jgi:histidyl-tRNA synthetase